MLMNFYLDVKTHDFKYKSFGRKIYARIKRTSKQSQLRPPKEELIFSFKTFIDAQQTH